jgi:hypothetical protein
MTRYYLTVQIRSDATFGRGAGLAGLVDVEIEHDQYGCPFIGGRALKGLLVEEWVNLRFALGDATWDDEGTWLFGTSGDAHAHVHVGAATLPPDLHSSIRSDVTSKPARLQPQDVLASLTAIRRQTAMDAKTGAPEDASLRAMRVLLRETDLIAQLNFDAEFENKERTLGLLAACALAVRRGGTGRNRGRGRLALLLHETEPVDYRDADFTRACFDAFAHEVRQ